MDNDMYNMQPPAAAASLLRRLRHLSLTPLALARAPSGAASACSSWAGRVRAWSPLVRSSSRGVLPL